MKWRLSGDAKEDFPLWTEVGWKSSEGAVNQLLALDDDGIIAWLKEHQSDHESLLDVWRIAVERNRARAITILDRLLQEGVLASGIWSNGLTAFYEVSDDDGLRDALAVLLVAHDI